MNLALPALLITVLVLPGVLVRRGYLYGRFYREPTRFSEELASSLMAAIVIQVVFLFAYQGVIARWTGLDIDFTVVLGLLTGKVSTDPTSFELSQKAIARHPLAVVSYFILQWLFAYFVGWVGRYVSTPIHRLVSSSESFVQRSVPQDWIPAVGGTQRSALQLSESLDQPDAATDDAGSRRFGQWLRACNVPDNLFEHFRNEAGLTSSANVLLLTVE